MTTGTALARTYIAELREAVGELPYRVAADIIAGVEEELDGLNDAKVAERIAQLGEPATIAASARQELGVQSSQPVKRKHDAAWYTITTVLALAVGGIVIPVAGWVIGVLLLWMSNTWTLRDKLTGSLLTGVGGAVAYWTFTRVSSVTGSVSIDGGPFRDVYRSAVSWPLVIGFSGAVLVLLGAVVYLLIRARRLKRTR